MKGGVKISSNLFNKPKSRVSTVYIPKPKKAFKTKRYLKERRFKTLKKKREKEVDDSDLGQLKSYKLCLAFIEKFLTKYEAVMNSGNVEKEANYSMFATMLAANLSYVNKEYDEIIDESDIVNNNNNNNNNVMNILTTNPYEYLENYLEYIEDEDILEDYEKVIDEYFNSFNTNKYNKHKMVINNNNNNNNSEQEYIAYSGFIRDSVSAIKDTIKKYSSELKTKKKINNNINIDDLIMGLTVMKIKGAPNAPKENVILNNAFFNKFMKLGL
jgi:hypothetical protein